MLELIGGIKMKIQDKIKIALLILVATGSSAVVWVKSFTDSKAKLPGIQALIFTAIMFSLVWVVLGMPGKSKKRSLGEIIDYLRQNGYKEIPINKDTLLGMNYPNSNKVVLKDDTEIAFLSYNSPPVATDNFNFASNNLQNKTEIKYSHTKSKGQYLEYAAKYEEKYEIVCVTANTVIHIITSETEEKQINKFLKMFSSIKNIKE